MDFVSEEEWNKLLEEAKKFDLEAYLARKAEADKQPEYIEWWESRPKPVQEAFKAMPFHHFYTDKETQTAVYRLYGVVELKDGSVGYHAVSAHLGWSNDVIGGIPAKGLLKVDEWSEDHLRKIRMTNCPGAYLIPSGWIAFASRH